MKGRDATERTEEREAFSDPLDQLEHRLGIELPDRALVKQALTHSSYLNEKPGAAPASNERLEFLGDAIIGAVVADHLYGTFPALPEGELTSLRAALVRARSLAGWARQLALGDLLLLGRGEEAHGGREREALLSSAFEAVMAALYLQHGYEGVREVLDRFIPSAIESILRRHAAVDAKSSLQHLCQSAGQGTPSYRVLDISGPPHRPVYTVEVLADSVSLARGIGRSKQAAEQAAATEALRKLEGSREPESGGIG